MTYLNADQILKADDTQYGQVEVPEWGGVVRVRSMSADTGSKLRDAVTKAAMSEFEQMAIVLIDCIVDESGKPIFGKDQINALAEKSNAAIQRVFLDIVNLSTPTDPEKN